MNKRAKRYDLAAIFRDPAKRRALIVPCIVALQAREGIVTTLEQAGAAYDRVLKERIKEGPLGPEFWGKDSR